MIITCLQIGLTMQDMYTLEVGTLLDFIIAYSNMNSKEEEKRGKNGKRKATQADIDAFFK